MSLPLDKRVAIVTGANQGLGLAIARAYIQAGASIMMCARDAALLEKAGTEVRSAAGASQVVLAQAADVSAPADVDRLMAAAFQAFPQVHILVNNAGVYGPMGSIEEVDWQEWAKAISINLNGSALMYRAIIPHFKKNRYGKIIQLSGGGASNPLPGISAYAASKAGVVRLAETVAEELRDYHVDVNAIAPGALNTRMLDQALAAGPGKVGQKFYEKALKQKTNGGAPPEKAAALALFLASAASDGITGKMISAVWDPWQKFQEYRADLAKTDVYTLRRIVPKDRGLTWGS